MTVFSLPTPSSERQVIIHTAAKCLVKSPGKTELTSVEPNLKTLDRISLQTPGSCQVTFTAVALSGWVLDSLLLPPGCEQKLSGISSQTFPIVLFSVRIRRRIVT